MIENSNVLLSLCIPTNGIIEWVFPVLDSIYCQNVSPELYEVIVTDNGNNDEFNKKMLDYESKKSNLKYRKTNAILFENQIEALKFASGEYLKFVNHRAVMNPGTIQWMIDLIKKTISYKPIIYLSDGALGVFNKQYYNDFDGFVKGLREFASWTTGVGVWRTDFERIPTNKEYNKISPHSDVLFAERNKEKYIIDDTKWSKDITNSHSNKGKYDLYRAFGVEEISITLQLYIDGDICADTLKYIINSYEDCVATFYMKFNILKEPCSYILDGFDDAMGIFLNKKRVVRKARRKLIQFKFRRINNKLRKVFL